MWLASWRDLLANWWSRVAVLSLPTPAALITSTRVLVSRRMYAEALSGCARSRDPFYLTSLSPSLSPSPLPGRDRGRRISGRTATPRRIASRDPTPTGGAESRSIAQTGSPFHPLILFRSLASCGNCQATCRLSGLLPPRCMLSLSRTLVKT